MSDHEQIWSAMLLNSGKLNHFHGAIISTISSLFRSIIYYFTTTVCAVILGIILVTVIRPGEGQSTGMQADQKVTRDVLTADTLLDLVR